MKKSVYLLLLFTAILTFSSCLEKDNKTVTNYSEKELIGKYSEKRMSYTYYHYFLNDGEGFSTYTRPDGGVYRRTLKWDIGNDDILNIVYDKDDAFIDINKSYKLEFDTNGDIQLTDIKNNSIVLYKKLNNSGTTNIDYKSKPFPCYIRFGGYYYELTKAVMRCKHAVSTEANSKQLQFFGSNGSLSPTSARFMYFTPYYEGIDKEWYDGTYMLTENSGYWVYGGVYTIGGSESDRCSGKLTIKTVGKMKVFDFNLDSGDVIGHFEGNWSYE